MTQESKEVLATEVPDRPARRSPAASGGWLAPAGKRLSGILAGLVLMVLAACAAPSPPPPTVVELAVVPAADLNPDPSGRPSPVVLRVYRLASDAGFAAADFFQLYEAEAATLGADLAGRDELMVLPGEGQTLVRELEPNARFLGVAAFYRDVDEAAWRAVVPVPPNQTTKLTASLDSLSVSLAPAAP